MKKLMIGIALTSALGLTACSEESIEELRQVAKDEGQVLIPTSKIVFDPANALLAVPNDLLFSGTTDGTLQMPGETLPEGQSPLTWRPDYKDPQTAIGALDGWSTTQPMVIDLDLAKDADGNVMSLDPNSVTPAAVRVFEAAVGGPLSSDPECTEAASVSACKIGDELTFGVDFVAQATGTDSFAILPLKAYKAATSYVVVITDALKDSSGQSIAPSATYTSLKLDIDTQPLALPEQIMLQALVNSYEKGVAAAHGVDAQGIIYSAIFTTQSTHNVMETTKLLMAADTLNPEAGAFDVALAPPQPYMMEVAPGMSIQVTAAMAAGMSLSGNPVEDKLYYLADATDVYVSMLSAPYLLDLPTLENCALVEGCPAVHSSWKAAGDSPISVLGAVLAGVLPTPEFLAQAEAQGVDGLAALQNPALIAGKNFSITVGVDGAGNPIQAPLDSARHLTRYNPIPLVKHPHNQIPVFITLPNEAKMAALKQMGVIDTDVVKPATGWPVAMSLHGLAGFKEMTLAIAPSYSAAGIATVSIDMPLHGDRAIDFDGDGVFDLSASESLAGDGKHDNASATVFMNLESFLTVRGNARQSILDHLALRLGISVLSQGQAMAMMSPTFDANNVSLVGLSLGAMVGTGVSAYASSGLVDPATGAVMDNPYKLTASSLVAPTAGSISMLLESPTFAPTVQEAVLASVVSDLNTENYEVGSDGYMAIVEQAQAALPDVLSAFAFAGQTIVDSSDPLAAGQLLAQTGNPVHMIEIVGDGNANLPDQVLPNTVSFSPTAGTEALIAAMGLESITETKMATPASGVVRFSKGHHSSLLDPNPVDGVSDPALSTIAFLEMQNQVITFAASQGTVLPVEVTQVVAGAE
ncbi:VolA/Pla-1 family phospholipase [Paraferrimonas sp. SM1919]|uniref:VolA/Pla-1 family phospholipase n=1 Tax=Paraferrimonas sp. SM1919 TaxID=2662263 RepID=UPI0013D3CAD7|nr:VolA/Pla-1 family phospholipase [Paraferrimonas sp. SM1919]